MSEPRPRTFRTWCDPVYRLCFHSPYLGRVTLPIRNLVARGLSRILYGPRGTNAVPIEDYSKVYQRELFRNEITSNASGDEHGQDLRFLVLWIPPARLSTDQRDRFAAAVNSIVGASIVDARAGNTKVELRTEEPGTRETDPAELLRDHDFVWIASGAQLPDSDMFERMDRFLARQPGADVVYFDTDAVDAQGIHSAPHFRYGWSQTLYESNDFIGEACVLRASRLTTQDPGIDWALDESTGSRALAAVIGTGGSVHGLSEVLGHWQPGTRPAGRTHRKPLEPRLSSTPLVSILIPFRDQEPVLRRCIESILAKTTYKDYELILISNGSKEPATLQYIEELDRQHDKVHLLHIDEPFNFSRLNNQGAAVAEGSHLVFLNNDTEVVTEDWLERLLHAADQDGVSAVGCKLLYPDRSIQHAGITLGGGSWTGKGHGVASLTYRGFVPGRDHDAMGVLDERRDVEAVTAACMLVDKAAFLAIDGFDETCLPVDFNDVDLCLRLQETGTRILYEPNATLIHHESYSRKPPEAGSEARRFRSEVDHMFERHGYRLEHDRYHNPNLSRTLGVNWLDVRAGRRSATERSHRS